MAPIHPFTFFPVPAGSDSQGKESRAVIRNRTLATAAVLALSFALLVPAAGATLVDRTVFAEEFGFST